MNSALGSAGCVIANYDILDKIFLNQMKWMNSETVCEIVKMNYNLFQIQ